MHVQNSIFVGLYCPITSDVVRPLYKGVPKKRIPSFIFGITLVIQHRF